MITLLNNSVYILLLIPIITFIIKVKLEYFSKTRYYDYIGDRYIDLKLNKRYVYGIINIPRLKDFNLN